MSSGIKFVKPILSWRTVSCWKCGVTCHDRVACCSFALKYIVSINLVLSNDYHNQVRQKKFNCLICRKAPWDLLMIALDWSTRTRCPVCTRGPPLFAACSLQIDSLARVFRVYTIHIVVRTKLRHCLRVINRKGFNRRFSVITCTLFLMYLSHFFAIFCSTARVVGICHDCLNGMIDLSFSFWSWCKASGEIKTKRRWTSRLNSHC